MNKEQIFKHFPGVVYSGIQQKRMRIDFASEGIEKLTKFSDKQFTDGSVVWEQLIHPLDQDRVEKKVRKALQEKSFLSTEYRIQTGDGVTHYIWDRRYFDFNEQDENAIPFEGFIIDVSERKHVETALLQAQGFAKAVLDTAVEAIITISRNGIVESFNHSAQKIFGYQSNEVIGNNVNMLMPQPYRSEHDGYLTNYLRSGQAKIIGIGREVTGLHKSGKTFPIYLSVNEVHHQTERKFVGLIRDLSEQRAVEIEAGEAREQLAHIDRVNMLNEMATGIAHEINQPLTAISMYAKTAIRMLSSDQPRPERLTEALEKLSVQAMRAGEVIERMQTMVRQRDSRREKIDCNDLLAGVYKLAEVEAQMRDIVMEFEPSGDDCNVYCDPVQIQQVVLNLLRNGMQAMESIQCGKGNQIVIKVEEQGEVVRFSVIDQGTGITSEAEKILFEPFSSTKMHGLGIGLSLCRSIINAHSGKIGYTNKISGGAIFYFTLPKMEQDAV